MKNKKLIAGILTCSMIGGSAAASLSCFAENSPEAIITSATSQAANPNLTVIEKLTELKELCKKRLTANISALKRSELEFKIKNIDHNIERAQAGKEVPSEAFELPAILTKSTSKPLEEKSSKFNWKKIAIGAGVIALTVGSGYAAYKFIPAVQDAINNNVLPLAQSGFDKAGNYTSSALSTTKNFAGDLYSNLYKSGKNVLSLAQTGLDVAEIYTSSALSTTKNFAGSLYSSISKSGKNVLSLAHVGLDKIGNFTGSAFNSTRSYISHSCSNLYYYISSKSHSNFSENEISLNLSNNTSPIKDNSTCPAI